jgi:hypothetical protein
MFQYELRLPIGLIMFVKVLKYCISRTSLSYEFHGIIILCEVELCYEGTKIVMNLMSHIK